VVTTGLSAWGATCLARARPHAWRFSRIAAPAQMGASG
jgi:hypothetical protein